MSRARARGTSRHVATEIRCSAKRLTSARAAEEKEKELAAKIDTLNDQLAPRDAAESVGAEAVARLAAMPIMHATRTARRGGVACICCAHACIRSAVTADTTACYGA
eukprot:6185857-Pleurochrysis_carterae.AAC.4